MKSVFYQTTPPTKNCYFDMKIEVVGPGISKDPNMQSPHLVACAKYIPPPDEGVTESSLAAMEIELPTGTEAYLEDLRQFRDGLYPVISYYALEGSTVVINIDSVPSEIFLCVGFRFRSEFRVGGAADSVFKVYEHQDKRSMCTKMYSYRETKLQSLCEGDQCQCMTAACATFRADVNPSLTVDKRLEETCKPTIRYAYKVKVKLSQPEGDFLIYKASVLEVLKPTDKELEGVRVGSEVDLVRRVTCSSVNVQVNRQYLILGSSGMETTQNNIYKFRFPLDSEAVVEEWPSECSQPSCSDYVAELNEYTFQLLLFGCPATPGMDAK